MYKVFYGHTCTWVLFRIDTLSVDVDVTVVETSQLLL